jgi:hypothetical protein
MKVTEAEIKAKLQEAAGEAVPLVAWGYGYVGPSLYTVRLVALAVWLLGLGIALLTFRNWILAGVATAVAAVVYFVLRARVKFCLLGVSQKHFLAIDVTPRGEFLPPAIQGLSSIQYPRLIEKELSTILHYVLGNGTLHYVRFQDFAHLPGNRDAARRIKQAVHDLVYDPPTVPASR